MFNHKYNKYKQKYLSLQQISQDGGGKINSFVSHALDVLELYNKALYTYFLYCVRFSNSVSLMSANSSVDLVKLSNIIKRIQDNPLIACFYSRLFSKKVEEQINSSKPVILSDISNESLIFSLRHITTNIIQDIYLKNNDSLESISKLTKYIKDIHTAEKEKSEKDTILLVDLGELIGKCKQLEGLVKAGLTEYKKPVNPQGLDILRDQTNELLWLIGNEFDNTTGLVPVDTNTKISDLFTLCFKNIVEFSNNITRVLDQ